MADLRRALRRTAIILVLGIGAAAACDASPGPSPSPTDVSVVDGVSVACIGYEQGECEAVARRILALAGDRRPSAFSATLVLFECRDGGVCPKSLAARDGHATIEFVDGGPPLESQLTGAPEAPVTSTVVAEFTERRLPRSPKVVGVGPFPFKPGHCGLLWQVDFDGSFWVPVGQVDGDANDLVNAGSGRILLLGPTLAEYIGDGGFTIGLVSFPGAKHISICG